MLKDHGHGLQWQELCVSAEVAGQGEEQHPGPRPLIGFSVQLVCFRV